MFQEELIFLDTHFSDQNDLFRKMGKEFIKKGYVGPGYVDALIDRENKFPTGIQIGNINLAIPHVDSTYIEKPGIAFIRPLEPIEFKEMCTDNKLKVNLIFMLLVKDKNKQVHVLSALMDKFSDEEYLESLKKEKDTNVLFDKLKKIIGDDNQ